MIQCESPGTHHEAPVASGLEIWDKSKLWLTYQSKSEGMKQNTPTPDAHTHTHT